MTHPTYHSALRAALVDLRERLATNRRIAPVSGSHRFGSGAVVRVQMNAGDVRWDASAHDACEPEWLKITRSMRAEPGYPIDAEEALLDQWRDGAPE